MSMTINPNMNAGCVNGATGIEPQIIDVNPTFHVRLDGELFSLRNAA